MLFIVLDDTGFGQLGCLRLADPDAQPRQARRGRPALQQHAHDRALLAEPLVHPDRPQPPLERDGVHHRGRDRLPRLERPHPVRERLPLGDAAGPRLQHDGARQVAPHAHRAVQRRRPLRSLAARAAASSASTASWAATRSQYYPDLVYDNHQVKPPRTPEEGYHLTEDLVDHAIEFIADAKQVAPDKPFFMYFCPGAMHAPHQVPREWADKYKGQFDDGWDAYREKVFQRQLELGIVPPGTKLSVRDPDVAAWSGRSRRREAPLRPHDGGLRRLPRAHRPSHRPAHRLPRAGCGGSTTRWSWWSATTAPAPRGDRTARSTRTCSSTTCPRRWRTTSRRSTSWAAPSTSTTIRGAGPGRATRRSGAGSARPTAAAPSDPFIVHWPPRDQGQGRGAEAVRAPHRHGADGAGRRSASSRPRRCAA